jgi:hypothetical protein
MLQTTRSKRAVAPIYSIDSAGKRQLELLEGLSGAVLSGLGSLSAVLARRHENQYRLREPQRSRIRGVAAGDKKERREKRLVAGNSAMHDGFPLISLH